MKKIWYLIPLFLFITGAQNIYAGGAMPPSKGREIRILLSSYSNSVELKINSGFSVINEKKKVLYKKSSGRRIRFTQQNGSLFLGKRNLRSSTAWVVPRKDGAIRVLANQYRGRVCVFVDNRGKLSVVNALHMEDYLRSVVPGEVSPRWPKEVLKAQAVAARTYATYHMLKNRGKPFHISSPLAQNYQGISKESKLTDLAVNATRAEVLYFNGYLFPTFFHSTCGGGTEFPQNVWPLDFKIPEVVPCDYCKDSPYFNWQITLSAKEVMRKFEQAGKPVPGLTKIYASRISKNRSHITEIACLTSEGEKRFRTNEFRRILGFNQIKSAKFKIQNNGSQITFKGWGWGHGVGMCQWGARGLAAHRKSYRKILSYYYPDCRLKKVRL